MLDFCLFILAAINDSLYSVWNYSEFYNVRLCTFFFIIVRISFYDSISHAFIVVENLTTDLSKQIKHTEDLSSEFLNFREKDTVDVELGDQIQKQNDCFLFSILLIHRVIVRKHDSGRKF